MKTIIIVLASLLSLSAFGQQSEQEDWKLLESRDGVEFYVMQVASRISNTSNTILKIKNTNAYEVEVNYSPEFTCNGTKLPQEVESFFLKAMDESAMKTYKICPDGTPKLELFKIMVARR